MCGEPLSHGRKSKGGKGKENSYGGNSDYALSSGPIGTKGSSRNYRYSDSDQDRYYR